MARLRLPAYMGRWCEKSQIVVDWTCDLSLWAHSTNHCATEPHTKKGLGQKKKQCWNIERVCFKSPHSTAVLHTDKLSYLRQGSDWAESGCPSYSPPAAAGCRVSSSWTCTLSRWQLWRDVLAAQLFPNWWVDGKILRRLCAYVKIQGGAEKIGWPGDLVRRE